MIDMRSVMNLGNPYQWLSNPNCSGHLLESWNLPSSKLTWQVGKSPFFHRRYNFKSKSFLFYCNLSFLGCNLLQKPTIRGTTGNAFEPRLSSIRTDAIWEGRDGLGRYNQRWLWSREEVGPWQTHTIPIISKHFRYLKSGFSNGATSLNLHRA